MVLHYTNLKKKLASVRLRSLPGWKGLPAALTGQDEKPATKDATSAADEDEERAVDERADMIRSLGQNLTETQLQDMINEVVGNTEDNGTIDFPKSLTMMAGVPPQPEDQAAAQTSKLQPRLPQVQPHRSVLLPNPSSKGQAGTPLLHGCSRGHLVDISFIQNIMGGG